MNLNDRVDKLIYQNIRQELEEFYNKLQAMLDSNKTGYIFTEDDSVIYERARNNAINSLNNKEKFKLFYENY